MEKLEGPGPPFRELLPLTPPGTALPFPWGHMPLLPPPMCSPVASQCVSQGPCRKARRPHAVLVPWAF